MPFTRQQFMGSSIRGFSTAIGWNGQQSSLTVQLVEDPENGDSFITPSIGSPAYFSFGSFSFNGIHQKFRKSNGPDGLPLYEVTLTDPRDLLEGVQVIVGGYSGGVSGTYNLFNPYGYWEATGFGNSLVNDTGMPWHLIKSALIALANQPAYLTHGGPITFRGIKYGLDLTQIPPVPSFYRIGGGHQISLLDLISRICEDTGCDFFVELIGLNIRIRTVSRASQPPLGTITALTTASNDIVRSSSGLELRNELTTAFLIGSDVSTLHQTDEISSFWGYDFLGNPILGQSFLMHFLVPGFTANLNLAMSTTILTATLDSWAPVNWSDPPFYMLIDNEVIQLTSLVGGAGGTWTYNITRGHFGTTPAFHAGGALAQKSFTSMIAERMTLNSSSISDIIGSVNYDCTSVELRLAKVNYESWACYMLHYRTTLANAIGLTSPIRNMGGLQGRAAPNLINDAPGNVNAMGANAVANDQWIKCMRVYEFVKAYADEYLGRKFAVSLPFIFKKQDPDTLKITSSYEISDGGYLPDGSAPLGLSLLNEDVFKNPDGRFRCFVTFTSTLNTDLSYINPQGTVIEGGTLFMEAQADPNLIYTPTPAAVITLQGPVLDKAVDTCGDVTVVSAVMQETPAKAREILEAAAFGALSLKVFPDYYLPDGAAIPLKSNILTYGPWVAIGAPGKVRAEQDHSLNPWTYGGYAPMNQAALARVNDALTNMQVSEEGFIEKVGLPTASLGDTLQAGGPNITNIDVSFGSNGVTTTYRFQTYSSRFGVFPRIAAERIKTLSKTSSELNRSIRTATREGIAKTAIAARADVAKRFLQHAPQVVRQESPHEVFVSYATHAGSGQQISDHPGEFPEAESGIIRTAVSTATYKEALAMANAHDSVKYQHTAMMSLNGLLRPFCTTPGTASDEVMSSFVTPTLSTDINVDTLNPWKDKNDIEVYHFGSTYAGLHAFRLQEDGQTPYTHARPLALRGPLVLSGWGFDWEGNPVPSEEPEVFMMNPQSWKTGPVDNLWDQRRGVWTSHDVLKGVTQEIIPGNYAGSGLVRVYHNAVDTGWDLACWNWFDGDIDALRRVYVGYNVVDNKWEVLHDAELGTLPEPPPSGCEELWIVLNESIPEFGSIVYTLEGGVDCCPTDDLHEWTGDGNGLLPNILLQRFDFLGSPIEMDWWQLSHNGNQANITNAACDPFIIEFDNWFIDTGTSQGTYSGSIIKPF